MIENTGRQDSTVSSYRVEVSELNQAFSNLEPMEGHIMVRGRHAQMVLHPNGLSVTQNVRIPAENSTNRGTLIFFIPGLNMQPFVDSGLKMQGEERRFGPLHWRLTLTDTMGSSASCDFVLQES